MRLKSRFTDNYAGNHPYVSSFEHTDSWRDANQCLQLCDLLTGCVRQALVPGSTARPVKVSAMNALQAALLPLGVKNLGASFWRGYADNTLNKHFPRFSVWCWRPDKDKRRK